MTSSQRDQQFAIHWLAIFSHGAVRFLSLMSQSVIRLPERSECADFDVAEKLTKQEAALLRVRLIEATGLIDDGATEGEASLLAGIDVTQHDRPLRVGYVPSPATIAAECERVRSTWTEQERKHRWRREGETAWELTVVKTSELVN